MVQEQCDTLNFSIYPTCCIYPVYYLDYKLRNYYHSYSCCTQRNKTQALIIAPDRHLKCFNCFGSQPWCKCITMVDVGFPFEQTAPVYTWEETQGTCVLRHSSNRTRTITGTITKKWERDGLARPKSSRHHSNE